MQTKPSLLKESLFSICGPGTYHFLGKTDSGKNYLFAQQLEHAVKKDKITFRNIVIFSSTGAFTDDWDFLKNYALTVKHTFNINDIVRIKEKCEKYLTIVKNKGGSLKHWKEKMATLIVFNDFAAEVNLSKQLNIVNALTAKNRHYGFYCCIMNQIKTTVNPGIYSNSCCIFNLEKNKTQVTEIAKLCMVSADVNKCIMWHSNKHHFTLWLNTPKHEKSQYEKYTKNPLYCFPVKKGKFFIKFLE